MGGSSKFIFSAGFTRVIAIIAIVSIHVTDALVSRENYFGGLSWWLGNIINSFSRIGVPLFIMLSGYFLLDKDKTLIISKHLKRTFFRILVPLLTWTLIYLLWRQYWYLEEFNPIYISRLFLSSWVFHLYYLFIILGLYLVTPWLKIYLNKASNSKKIGLIVGSFLFGFVVTLLTYLFPQLILYINSFNIFTLYLGYYLAGDYLRQVSISKPKGLILFLTLSFFTLVTSYLTFLVKKLFLGGEKNFLTLSPGNYFGEYLSLNIIIMSLCAFVLLMNIDALFPRIKKSLTFSLVTIISSVAFGIYLIHPMVIDALDHYANMAIHLITANLWLYILEKIFLVFIISGLITFIAIKIPFLKRAWGEK